MNENIEILQDIYKGSEMAYYALEKIAKNFKNNKSELKNIVKNELKEYKKYMQETKDLLNQKDENIKESGFFAKLGSSIEISMKISPDDLSSVSEILLKGLQMGIKQMEEKLKEYKDKLDIEILKLAQKFLEYQKEEKAKIDVN